MKDSDKIVTLAKVAKLAGISKTTASMVFNNYDNISAATRSRVLAAAEQLGYARKNVKKRQLKKEDHQPVSLVICGDESLDTNPYYLSIISGAVSLLKEREKEMVLTHWSSAEQLNKIYMEHGWQPSGLIVTGWCNEACLDFIKTSKIPAVFVAADIRLENYDYIGADNYQAVRLAYQYLKSLGHRKITAIAGDLKHVAWREKREMFLSQAVGDHIEDRIIVLDDSAALKKAFHELYEKFGDTTAILAASDYIAGHFIGMCHEKGIHCPQDISVIGIDGIPLGGWIAPPLTTVDTDLKEMGISGAWRVLERAAHPDLPVATIHPRAKLIERASCRRI